MNNKTSPLNLSVSSFLLKSLRKTPIFYSSTLTLDHMTVCNVKGVTYGDTHTPSELDNDLYLVVIVVLWPATVLFSVHSHGSQSFSDTAVVMGSQYTLFQYIVLENTT